MATARVGIDLASEKKKPREALGHASRGFLAMVLRHFLPGILFRSV